MRGVSTRQGSNGAKIGWMYDYCWVDGVGSQLWVITSSVKCNRERVTPDTFDAIRHARLDTTGSSRLSLRRNKIENPRHANFGLALDSICA